MIGRDMMQMPAWFARAWVESNPPGDMFEQIMALQGEVFRDVPGRRTLRFELQGKSYFAKLHEGVGWGEIFKNLVTMRMPILGAETEWHAIRRLDELGILTTPAVAFARRGINPAGQRSFIITQDLGDIVSLEALCADWARQPPAPCFKRRLIQAVAKLARGMHDNGLNHRDFYLCHLCLDNPRLARNEIHLYVVDLHRVGIRSEILPGARIKDMAGLFFSAMDIGLTRRDYLRFMREYRGDLRLSLQRDKRFWQRVQARACRLYHKFHGRWPDMPAAAD